MNTLPRDIQYAILIQLDWPELGQICATNKAFHELCSNELYWRSKYLSDFGEPYTGSEFAKEGYFNRYLQKVKEELYQTIYDRIDEEEKERFPKLFERYFGNFCTKIGSNLEYYEDLQVKFFSETKIEMSKHNSYDSTWSGQLAAYADNRMEIANFIENKMNKIVTAKRSLTK